MIGGKCFSRSIKATLCLAGSILGSCLGGQSVTEREDIQAFIADVSDRTGIKEDTLTAALSQSNYRQDVIDLITRPAEGTMTWERYRKLFISERRIDNGVKFWHENTAALNKAQSVFGVPPKVVVSIIGVETSYGRNLGTYPVVDALVTLGFGYPRRASFFSRQLEEFLVLACEERVEPFTQDPACQSNSPTGSARPFANITDLKGSYAGAMGIGQFIPSSFRDFAIDFDGDRYRDIWGNKTDAIGSVANYLKIHGWNNTHPVVLDVEIEVVSDELADLTDSSRKPNKTVGEWRSLGVSVPNTQESLSAALFRFTTSSGDFYRLGFNDFFVITEYNHSKMYAAAVWELANAIEVRK